MFRQLLAYQLQSLTASVGVGSGFIRVENFSIQEVHGGGLQSASYAGTGNFRIKSNREHRQGVGINGKGERRSGRDGRTVRHT